MNAFAVTGYAPARRIALLIDADNVSPDKSAAMLDVLSRYGTVTIRRAYGDWGNECLKGWRAKAQEGGIKPIQQCSYTSGKNASDIALVIDAMELLYTRAPDAFCIASSDADFTPLVLQLKSHGHDVYGFGERKTPGAFVKACTRFVYLEDIGEPAMGDPLAVVACDTKVEPVPVTDATKALRQNTKLVLGLRKAVEAAMRDDGWAMIGPGGTAALQRASISPKAHGVKNFPALFEAIGLFEIFESATGEKYVADKRNGKRAAQPAGVIAAAR